MPLQRQVPLLSGGVLGESYFVNPYMVELFHLAADSLFGGRAHVIIRAPAGAAGPVTMERNRAVYELHHSHQ